MSEKSVRIGIIGAGRNTWVAAPARGVAFGAGKCIISAADRERDVGAKEKRE